MPKPVREKERYVFHGKMTSLETTANLMPFKSLRFRGRLFLALCLLGSWLTGSGKASEGNSPSESANSPSESSNSLSWFPMDPQLRQTCLSWQSGPSNPGFIPSNLQVRVLLKDRVPVDSLEIAWDASNTPSTERARSTVKLLLAKAALLQPLWLERFTALGGDLGQGHLTSIQPYWISSLFVLEASPAYILALLERYASEIEWIEMDHDKAHAADPVLQAPASPPGTESVGGTEIGLRTVQAPQMWRRGYKGRGRLGMNIDTGVWGTHPALSNRWRGNFVPASQAWFGSGSVPTDCGGTTSHGSHVMGTMVGLDPVNQDTIGLAIQSQWIAAGALCTGGSTTAAFQWALNPDGLTSTVHDMPDVINNSWGGSTQDSAQCNSPTYVPLFNALSAAGIAVVFSAGNSGSGASTITSPKNININDVNVFCTGNVSVSPTNVINIAPSSSRGPSICLSSDSSLLIKPELVAPGTNVRSVGGASGYANLTGTSMASPHVSGAVLLLKEAFPNLPGSTLLRGLYQSGLDLGSVGEDNQYGNGLLQVDSAFRLLALTHTPTPPYRGRYNLTVRGPLVQPSPLCSDSLQLTYVVTNQGDSVVPSYRLGYGLLPNNLTFLQRPVALGPNLSDTVSTGTLLLSPSGGSQPSAPTVYVQAWPNQVLEEDSTDNILQHNLNVRAVWSTPLLQNFETGTLTTTGYRTLNPDNDITWSYSTSSGLATGFRSLYINAFNYNNLNQRDYIETGQIPIPNSGRFLFRFQRAYAHNNRRQTQNQAAWDSLLISASTDCGTTYQRLWAQGGTSLGTTAPDSTAFIPFYAHQWRRDTLDLAHLRPASSVILRVEFFNRQGNNLYLDDFQVLVDSMAPIASFDWETSGCRPIQLQVRSDATFADSIRWLLPGGLTSAATQVTLNPPPGSVSVTLIAYNRFGTDSITRIISIPYTPVAAFSLTRDTIVRGALLGLLNQSQYGSYYVWNFGDGSPLTAGYAPQKRYNQPGVYPISLWVYGANQCVDSLLQHKEVVVIPPVGIQEFLMRSPTVYPNPGNGLLTVGISELELPLGLEARIMDLTGRTMSTKQWSPEACQQNLLEWDIFSGNTNNQSLSQGYYLLQFQDLRGGRSVQRYLLQP